MLDREALRLGEMSNQEIDELLGSLTLDGRAGLVEFSWRVLERIQAPEEPPNKYFDKAGHCFSTAFRLYPR